MQVDYKLVEGNNMRRGKPQQEFYTPGSGKLRRSNPNFDDTISESGSTRSSRSGFASSDDVRGRQDYDNFDNHSGRDTQRRLRKPERELYVPRPVAHAREQYSPQTHIRPQQQSSGLVNGAEDNMSNMKRYSSNRNNDDHNGGRGNGPSEWRDKSPVRNHRMGSEPRGGYNNSQTWHRSSDRDRERNYRDRDTKSVEPSGVVYRSNDGNKAQSKPPSGRRHSTVGNYHYNNEQEKKKSLIQYLENLPPRFRKKYMENNGIKPEDLELDQPQTSSSTQYLPSSQPPLSGYSSLPHNPTSNQTYNNSNIQNSGYYTLPGRQRGRGRYCNRDVDFRPLTPDRPGIKSPINSRPSTPTNRRYDSSGPPSRSHTPLASYDDHRGRNDGSSESQRNDSWGDRGGSGRPSVVDRLGNRHSEPPRHFERDRERGSYDYDRQRRDDDNRNRRDDNRNRTGDRRNEPERDREHSDRDRRKGDRRKKGGREKRSSSRDLTRQDSRESNYSSGSTRTLTEVKDKQSYSVQDRLMVNNNSCTADVSTKEVDVVIEDKREEVIVEKFYEDKEILDWSEEVELNHPLEPEIFSDTLTRSSSVASLQDISTKSMPASTTPNGKKKRKNGRRKSKQRSGSSYRDETPTNRDRKDSFASIDGREFRVPQDPATGRRRRRRSSRDASFERFHNKSRGPSRDVSFERGNENWRDEIIRSRQNSEREGSVVSRKVTVDRSRKNSELDENTLAEAPSKKGGILVLPTKSPEPPRSSAERPKFPDIRRTPGPQKTLFDPKNPNKPILVKSPGSRVSVPGFSENNSEIPPKMDTADSSGRLVPNWYNESSEDFKSCHFGDLLRDIKLADTELQFIMNNGLLLVDYETVDNLRQFLKSALEDLLCKALKFCQTENVEQHLWRILYHNIIELTRKAIIDDPGNKQQYKGFLLYLIDEGTKYFERLIGTLEDTYNFKVSSYVGNNSMSQHKGLGFTGLALVSAQKLFLFLGDLGRYREEVNETSNYGKCRQWYIKAHEINPKNGRPYNQLAVLAVYSRRKLDAVYYYMRSLMASNPVISAKERLNTLFDENRKKYEQGQKKRREERLERQRQHMKQKESEENGTPNFLRKETWLHPEGGRTLHRTTKALHEDEQDSEEEDLAALSSVDVNKRFVTSYLHVHGKLITKIGMESFQDAAMQMLKEFRALLQHSPVSLPCNRFLQLLALNMFAIESTQLKDINLQQSSSYRSEFQERALIISLQMFNLILERCVSILQDYHAQFIDQGKSGSPLDSLPHDANVLLPAIKVWCDWMLCHTSVWNPPPSTGDYKVGPSGDLWSRLGLLMNILERMDQHSTDVITKESKEGYDPVKLPEDAILSGFTPLSFHDCEVSYAPVNMDAEIAQLRLRVAKLLFFGTVYLCGLEPPVLKLEIEDGRRDYVSVVCTDRGRDSPSRSVLARNDDVLLETFSGDDEEITNLNDNISKLNVSEASTEVQHLLSRKLELEKRKRSEELHQQRVMKILSQSVVSVHLEIRPKYLVPDTNCFIDHLDSIQTLATSHTYTLMVPIVVLSELEGLSKGTPLSTTVTKSKSAPTADHVQRVAVASRLALDLLKKRHASVKCVTTKGTVLPSTSFSTEDDTTWDATVKNDDKILTTCLVLCKNQQAGDPKEGEPRHLIREVVLLTEDRNLRVKAHARDVPVRALPDFMRWSGLGG
ncbi:telomerase-binding protein EST1A-like isoform X2 [Anthonomus grandis grandis]|uniref:telomerase-binding protein EST1A-like isoform X2 n=1 Tax=Anthonomus grandis grandis TaxID=2921223 RepID=UPI00216542E1|nr:telomerase-binding protein EST1A-like isoform X2 [Anthonomus grandis grandis]